VNASRLLLAAFFILAGTNHFIAPSSDDNHEEWMGGCPRKSAAWFQKIDRPQGCSFKGVAQRGAPPCG
jgi:hypothetical protein